MLAVELRHYPNGSCWLYLVLFWAPLYIDEEKLSFAEKQKKSKSHDFVIILVVWCMNHLLLLFVDNNGAVEHIFRD